MNKRFAVLLPLVIFLTGALLSGCAYDPQGHRCRCRYHERLSGCAYDPQEAPKSQPVKVEQIIEDNQALAIDGSHEAILIFFYQEKNEVVADQLPIVEAAAKEWRGRVKVSKLDVLWETQHTHNAPHVTFYDVHNVPSFVLRRKGDVFYHKHVGFLSEPQLRDFITRSLATDPAPAPESKR
ncbi:MAG TPA: thioredoxin family protein [Candidatus Obscuribacterales bacterium]